MQTFTVASTDKGTRLDLFLTLHLPSFSRTSVRKILDMGKVKIGDSVEYRPNYRIQGDEIIAIDVEGIQLERKKLPASDVRVPIVYQDEHIVVVDKPSGLKVHPTYSNDQKSLLNALYGQLEDQLGPYGINLVNRIDSDTSGLVVLAISPEGAWHYAKMFANAKVSKEYVCVVSSKWLSQPTEDEWVRVSNFIRYDAEERKQFVVQTRGVHSETWFKFLDFTDSEDYVQLIAKPVTGRTHQIRVHAAHLGYPILGDRKYDGNPAPRLMLHAYKLTLPKYGGGELTVSAPVPEEFKLENYDG